MVFGRSFQGSYIIACIMVICFHLFCFTSVYKQSYNKQHYHRILPPTLYYSEIAIPDFDAIAHVVMSQCLSSILDCSHLFQCHTQSRLLSISVLPFRTRDNVSLSYKAGEICALQLTLMIWTLCTVLSHHTLPLVPTCKHIVLESADSQSEKSFMSAGGSAKE